MRVLSSLETEYVAYRITATNYDGTNLDLSGDVVKLAFVAVGTEPTTGDWHTAVWVTTGVAGVLVGPSPAVPLTTGVYDVWAEVLDNPEQPQHQVGTLRIT